MAIRRPPRTTRCFHRWLRSSAPATIARIQSSRDSPPPTGDCPGSSFGALFHRTSLWWVTIAVTAAWKTESNRRGVRTPSGRSQSAGAVRRCEVRRLRLCGFPSVVRSDDAVPSMLQLVSMREACAARTRRRPTEACLADPCMSAVSAEASTTGGQPASCSWATSVKIPTMHGDVIARQTEAGLVLTCCRAASRGRAWAAAAPVAFIHSEIDVTSFKTSQLCNVDAHARAPCHSARYSSGIPMMPP